MAQFPGLMLWTDVWLADTHHLTRLERGTYIDLLVLMWRTPGCRVPNDDAWLARHMRMTADEVVKELRPIIKEFCQTDGNWLFQKRLQIEFVRAFKRSQKQTDRANTRWDKDKDLCRGNAGAAMHLDLSKIHSSFPLPHTRATGVDNSDTEPDEEKQAAGDKKETKISAELIQFEMAKRPKEG